MKFNSYRLLFGPRPEPCFSLGCFPKPEITPMAIHAAPAFLRGMKALFVSDVHLRKSVKDAALSALIKQIAAQQADLLLLGGDYAETPDQCARFFDALKEVHPPLGIWGVPGNNDPRESETLRAMMRTGNAVLLKNRAAQLDLPGGKLEIAGCDDHKYGSPQTRNLFSEANGSYRILLSHFPTLPDCDCNLMLSGHTHGGQFNLLGITPYSIGFELRYRIRAVSGMHRIDSMQLAICNGIGVSRLPLRIGAKPQMLLLEFLE